MQYNEIFKTTQIVQTNFFSPYLMTEQKQPGDPLT